MDQVVGAVDALERGLEPGPGDRVAGDDLDTRDDRVRPARERPHGVAARLQARDQRGADEARRAGDEHVHDTIIA